MFPSPEQLSAMYEWPEGHWFRLNVVVNDAHELVGVDGTSNSISSAHDRQILKIIRADADIVIVGSNSVRKEGWHIPPRGVLGVVRRTSIAPQGCPDPSRVVVGPLDEVLSRSANLNRVLSEGGRFVARELLKLDVLDEIFLTMPHQDSGRPRTLPDWMAEASPATWKLERTFDDSIQAFTTWRRATS